MSVGATAAPVCSRPRLGDASHSGCCVLEAHNLSLWSRSSLGCGSSLGTLPPCLGAFHRASVELRDALCHHGTPKPGVHREYGTSLPAWYAGYVDCGCRGEALLAPSHHATRAARVAALQTLPAHQLLPLNQLPTCFRLSGPPARHTSCPPAQCCSHAPGLCELVAVTLVWCVDLLTPQFRNTRHKLVMASWLGASEGNLPAGKPPGNLPRRLKHVPH